MLVENLDLEVVYSRSDWFGWRRGEPGPGGYYIFLGSFTGVGEGRTVDQALNDLVNELRVWIEEHDAEHEGYPFIPRRDESELVDLIRCLLAAGTAYEALRARLPPATLSPGDRPPGG